MALQRYTNRGAQTQGDGDSAQDVNRIELTNIYDSLQDRNDDVHPYNTVRSGAEPTNTGANHADSKENSKIKIELSCKAICLTLTGILLFCTLICAISGFIVYHVVTAKIADSGTQTSQSQNKTLPTNNPDTFATDIDILKNQISSLNNASRNTKNQLDSLNNATRDTKNQLESLNNASRDTNNQLESLNNSSRDTKNQLESLNNSSRDTTNQLESLSSVVQAIREKQNNSEKAVAFSVHTPTGSLTSSKSPIFSTTLVNTGHYNLSTGIFTCPVAGIYSFSATLYADSSSTSDVYCIYRVNGSYTSFVRSYHDVWDTTSSTLVVTLDVGDVVYLYCYGWDGVFHGYHTSFSGVLITAT